MQPNQREGRRPVRRAALLLAAVFALALTSVPASAQLDPGVRWVLLTGSWSPEAPASPAWFDLETWRLAVRFDGVPPRVAPVGAPSSWIPVAGDFDGDRVDTVMMFDPATWRVVPAEGRPVEVSTEPERVPWVPVAGDWDGRGIDTILVFDLRDASLHRLEEGPIRIERWDPDPNPWRPLVGDFTGRGLDVVALSQDDERTGADPDWAQVAGDWDGDGIDTFGSIYVPTGELVAGAPVELASRAAATSAVTPKDAASIFYKGGGGGGGGGCWSYTTNHQVSFKKLSCMSIVTETWLEWTCCPLTSNPSGPSICGKKFKTAIHTYGGVC